MIKNRYYTYINTTDVQQRLYVTVRLPNGEVVINQKTLSPKQVAGDLAEEFRNVHGKNTEILSVSATEVTRDSSGALTTSVKRVVPGAHSLSREEIIKRSILMDIETTGLRGGDIMHQIAVYDPTAKKGYLYRPKPELIISDKEGGEQALSRRNAQRLQSRRYGVKTHRQGKLASTLVEMIQAGEDVTRMGATVADAADAFRRGSIDVFDLAEKLIPEAEKAPVGSSVEDYLVKTDRFQALLLADEAKLEKAGIGVDAAGNLSDETKAKRKIFQSISSGSATQKELLSFIQDATGKTTSDIADRFKGGLEIKYDASIRELMKDDLANVLRGKVTWIANASFEAKQFGSQIDALAKESLDALNTERAIKGLDPIDEAKYMRGFQYGRYEQEIEALNKVRVASGGDSLLAKNPFFGVIEGVSATSGDPFYSTNLEYNKIKGEALRSKDYSRLYDAILKHTGAGDVRDILDLVRSQQSQLINKGLIDQKSPTSLSMEVQGRLYGFTEQMRIAEEAGQKMSMQDALASLQEAESHMALGDTSVTEARVFSESMDQLEAKRLVDLGGAKGQALMRQASRGEGAYFRYLTYGHLANYFSQQARLSTGEISSGLDDIAFRQRIGKSMVEMADRSALIKREQLPGYRIVEQAKQIGDVVEKVKVPVGPKSRQVRLTSIDEVFEHLSDLQEYAHVDKARAIEDAKNKYGKFFDAATGSLKEGEAAALREFALKEAEASHEVVDMFFKRTSSGQITQHFMDNIKMFVGSGDVSRTIITPTTSPIESAAESVQRTAARQESDLVSQSLRKIAKSHLGKYAAIVGGFAALSAKTEHKEDYGNLLAPDYESFLEAQSQFYGNDKEAYINSVKAKYGRLEGLPKTGIASILNKAFTDFGSPYQGPAYTQGVLEDHNLRRERHKYIQQQFGMRHFSAQGDIGLFLKSFLSTAFRREMGTSRESRNVIFGGARPITGERYGSGARGKNLIEYKFGRDQFEFDIQDADTISIRRKGNIGSPLSNFMGTGRQDSMSIRLAGIDAPETAHQDRKAQPFAEKAKAIAKDLMSKAKDIRLVTRQGDTTYGRQVGMIYVDGKNLNLELVKRGAAAYLPYKSKGKPPIYNQKAFEDAQEYAQESKRGMWNTGYFQAYKEISKASGETVTFNTLANISKVSRNANLMSLYSLMHQADRAGGVTEQMMGDIRQTAERFKASQSKSDRSIFGPDKKFSQAHSLDLLSHSYSTNSILSSLDQIKSDLGGLIKNRGSSTTEHKFKSRSLRENNYHMVKDTLKAKKVHEGAKINKARENEFAKMQQYKRQVMMESLQLAANQNMFNSPIGHHRM